MKSKKLIGFFVAAIVFVSVGIGITGVGSAKILKDNVFGNLKNKAIDSEVKFDIPDENFIAVINIEGTISESDETSIFSNSSGYNHKAILELVDKLMDTSNNKGILLEMNTPGGTVYASDELYLKLKEYKEVTKKPVYTYMKSEACSGGYYISMASDKIYANRNAWTGSIGVIISLTNLQGLYDKYGIEEINITSGSNKSMGSAGVELTQEQRNIFQGMVDESYNQFISVIVENRDLDEAKVRELADGRIYTATQAANNKLIDSVCTYDEAVEDIEEQIDSDVFFYNPIVENKSLLSGIFNVVSQTKQKSDVEILTEFLEKQGNEVPLYYAK